MQPSVHSDEEQFQITASMDDSGRATLRIVGQLDLVTEPELQSELDRLLVRGPAELCLDLSSATFVSVRGYALIGNAGEQVDRVVVCSASTLAKKVLVALGHERVICCRSPRPVPTHAR